MNESELALAIPVGAEGALEGQLRRQLEALGIDQALGRATSALDKRCIEAAHSVLTDEEVAPGYIHAGFAMTALPHKRTDATEWLRDGADVRLRIESGKSHDGTVPAFHSVMSPVLSCFTYKPRQLRRARAK